MRPHPFLLVAILAGCGGSSAQQVTMPPMPAPRTSAALAGPLCEGGVCRCRSGDADAGAPGAGYKRYEVKVGPVDNDLWVTIDDNVLYKSRERAIECFYVDLSAPSDHQVTVRVHGDAGFGVRVAISELRADPPSWYHTFQIGCGAPGACDKGQLDAWRRGLDKYKRGIHDPCGSTKIKGLLWDTGKMPDVGVPADLYVEMTMQLYGFVPEHASGDPACAENYE